ncbi:MAG TPA: hypothetical protein VNA19_11415 [Pyrinomonadaceae bacterium]|nr:hypothetical protein [Pyrinomonadaceae bacterium]
MDDGQNISIEGWVILRNSIGDSHKQFGYGLSSIVHRPLTSIVHRL